METSHSGHSKYITSEIKTCRFLFHRYANSNECQDYHSVLSCRLRFHPATLIEMYTKCIRLRVFFSLTFGRRYYFSQKFNSKTRSCHGLHRPSSKFRIETNHFKIWHSFWGTVKAIFSLPPFRGHLCNKPPSLLITPSFRQADENDFSAIFSGVSVTLYWNVFFNFRIIVELGYKWRFLCKTVIHNPFLVLF